MGIACCVGSLKTVKAKGFSSKSLGQMGMKMLTRRVKMRGCHLTLIVIGQVGKVGLLCSCDSPFQLSYQGLQILKEWMKRKQCKLISQTTMVSSILVSYCFSFSAAFGFSKYQGLPQWLLPLWSPKCLSFGFIINTSGNQFSFPSSNSESFCSSWSSK